MRHRTHRFSPHLLHIATLVLLLSVLAFALPARSLEIAIPSDMFNSEVTATGTTPGEYYFMDIFSINPQSGRYRAFLTVYDWQGNLVWYRQPNQEEERLSAFWPLENHDRFIYNLGNPNDALGLVILDGGYVPLDTLPRTNPHSNDYALDAHDFLMDDDGNYWSLWRDWRIVDMSDVGGFPDAHVASHVIEQWDPDHNRLWTWNGHEHTDELPYTGQHNPNNYTHYSFEQMHANSLQLLSSGNLLVSVREMSLVVVIEVPSGDVIAKLGGGPENEWTFESALADTSIPADFAVQHDARLLPNGNLTVFDNGNLHPTNQTSYAKEYELDFDTQTATLILAYAADPTSRSRFMGSFRRDDDGNSLVGWGNKTPTIDGTEIDPDGTLLWSINHQADVHNGLANTDSYRIIKSTAHGPSTLPYVTGRGTGNGMLLYCNWFGHEDETASFEVYYGQTPDPPFHSLATSGEHLIPDAVFSGVWYTKIRALDAEGQVISDFSEVRWFDFGNGVDEIESPTSPPTSITLLPVYPNPLNGIGRIRLTVNRPGPVRIALYDVLGRQVTTLVHGSLSAGQHEFALDGSVVSSGTYYLRAAHNGEGSAVQRVTILK